MGCHIAIVWSSRMEEEEEVSAGETSSFTKAGGGRPQGSKKLQVCVTDLNWTNLASAHGEPLLPQEGGQLRLGGHPLQAHRGRGRPKGSKRAASTENGSTAEHFPKKRGRPKKELSAGDLPNGGPSPPQRGRPKGSMKRKSEPAVENGGSSETPRERGRPKSKKPRLEGGSDQTKNAQKRRRGRPRKAGLTISKFNGMTKTRGRPRKIQEPLAAGSSPKKRGRGRPKGSLNKKPPVFVGPGKLGRPPKGKKRGRPRQQPAKRGRPRKYPLPPPEELNKPKVWKPLGRPRKYPRVEPPEGAPAAPRRARGRPRKSESKKGAHLRKSLATGPPAPLGSSDGLQRKKGRPPNDAKREGAAPKKRGRPKGSVNKNKAPVSPSHSNDSRAAGEEGEAEKGAETLA